LNALARAGENVIGDRRVHRWSFLWRRQCRLQCPDRVVERQPVRFEDFRGIASGISDDGGEHDGSVDIASAASACCGCGRFEDTPNVLRDAERVLRVRGLVRRALQDAGDDVGLETLAVDLARVEHGLGVWIIAESREQMLKRDIGRACCSGKVGAARQRRREIRRHRNLRNICGRHAHDVSRNEGQDGQDWP
jgi:hypothetical protein